MTKILFRKLPTLQEFSYIQINEIKDLNETGVYIHSSADANIKETDYEESEFIFKTKEEKDEAISFISSKSIRIE